VSPLRPAVICCEQVQRFRQISKSSTPVVPSISIFGVRRRGPTAPNPIASLRVRDAGVDHLFPVRENPPEIVIVSKADGRSDVRQTFAKTAVAKIQIVRLDQATQSNQHVRLLWPKAVRTVRATDVVSMCVHMTPDPIFGFGIEILKGNGVEQNPRAAMGSILRHVCLNPRRSILLIDGH